MGGPICTVSIMAKETVAQLKIEINKQKGHINSSAMRLFHGADELTDMGQQLQYIGASREAEGMEWR